MVDLLKGLSLPSWLAEIAAPLIQVALLLGFVALSAVFFIWLERKVAGRIQDRLDDLQLHTVALCRLFHFSLYAPNVLLGPLT